MVPNRNGDIHLAGGEVPGRLRPAAGSRHDIDRCRAIPRGIDASAHTIAIMFRSYFLPLPVHARRLAGVYLHAIHTDVALSCFWISSNDAWKSDESPGIFRPTLENWKLQQVDLVASNYFFARPSGDALRKELPHFREHREHFDLI